MPNSLLAIHIIGITITISFFMITLVIFIFFSLAIFSSRPIGVQAGNLMILALISPLGLTIIFLRKVVGRIYDRLYNATNRLPEV